MQLPAMRQTDIVIILYTGDVYYTATRHGLDGWEIESRWGQDIPHPSRPALEPTQPPTKWKPFLFPGVKRPGRAVNHPLPSSAEV
jgi:hypothetical protein